MSADEPDDIDRAWWKESFVYQIYPQSFNDSDGDGVGDIQGIIDRLDYLDDLGVEIVWVNPLYDSPHVDNGYDIRDYRSILAEYGTMSDFDELLAEMHDRDMRLIMDLVVNHTSDEHVWFQKSRQREDPYTDYYWWHDGDGSEPPNNWTSGFGGSAWEYDEAREQYYLHLFDEKQPDLNWENEAVREEVYEMINWWLEKGIDGFRMDVFNLISKPTDLPDGDEEEGGSARAVRERPEGARLRRRDGRGDVRRLRRDDRRRGDRRRRRGRKTVLRHQRGRPEHAVSLRARPAGFRRRRGWWKVDPWELDDLREILSKWQRELDGDDAWNTVFLGTHDWPRIVSRWGDDGQYRRESAKLLATLLFSLQGTPSSFRATRSG
ncbi:alpha-amylase family glycosyl hydrolase [Halomicroarcula sp. GCM10025709]|uniref:alpha-amylase family glycosyl hydrolase n=1 Tax=Halomicroarcula sp. GCM10025709 TaxID=3252669 RepID=UPI0036109B43